MAFIALKREGEGLNAINAMHPECTQYNCFISHGHSYHGYV